MQSAPPRWRWNELIKTTSKIFGLDIDTNFTDYYYDEIIYTSYTKDRYYHTLVHIEDMLIHVRDFKFKSHKDRILLKWAVWFHDIIYDPSKSDNEAKSAQKLEDFMIALDFKESDINISKWLILVTSHKGEPQTYIEDIICDLDLRLFINDQSEITRLIRKEFHMQSDKDFYDGRKKFLQFMNNKEHIYHTNLYQNTQSDHAKHNIEDELNTI